MTRRFALRLALLVVTLGLVASAAPVGAADIQLFTGMLPYPPVATGPCANTGQTMYFTDTGTTEVYTTSQSPAAANRVTITGDGFTVADQFGQGQGVGRATCTESMKIRSFYERPNGGGVTQWGIAFRVVSATFHGGAHLIPGTQMYVSYRFGTTGTPFNAMSNYPNGYNGDYDLTIPNTVAPTGDDWSTCSNYQTSPEPTLSFSTGYSFSKWDGGRSTLTGDHNGKVWVTYTIEYTTCTP